MEKSGWRTTIIVIGSHTGTHIDAPSHCLPHGATIDRTRLDMISGPAIVINLRHKKPRQKITKADVQDFAPLIRRTKRVLLNLGWDRYFDRPGRPNYYTEFPEIAPSLATWFTKLGIKLLGTDTPSPSLTDDLLVHKILMKGQVSIIENLANLNKLANQVIFFVCMPLKLIEADGSPIRAAGIPISAIQKWPKLFNLINPSS